MNKFILALLFCFSLQAAFAQKPEYTSFPSHDGEFSGIMLIVDETQLKEFSKPSTQGMTFKSKSKARVGEVFAIKFAFMGMQVARDLMTDVTFDIKILDPDGKIYDHLDLKNLNALKAKVPTDKRFYIFDSQSFFKIIFEPKDMPGQYKIVAELKDNVGKKKISLEKKIELLK